MRAGSKLLKPCDGTRRQLARNVAGFKYALTQVAGAILASTWMCNASEYKGDPSCWSSPFNFDECCLKLNPSCWDSTYTFTRCCVDPEEDARSNSYSFQTFAHRARHWRSGGKLDRPVSGIGSTIASAGPFAEFLMSWLAAHKIRSIIEASCGHWPTGWQRSVRWPAVEYIGIDILPEMVADSEAYCNASVPKDCGFLSAHFLALDILQDTLPAADLLITKDTLIHFPNRHIARFLNLSVLVCPPRFKYIMFVHERYPHDGPGTSLNNADVGEDFPSSGMFVTHFLDMAAAPFSLSTEIVFEWGDTKVVQLFRPPVC